MRTASLFFILLYSFSLVGYGTVTVAHIVAHKVSAFIPVHDHGHHHHHHGQKDHHHHNRNDHHHTLEDHHHVTKTLAQQTPDTQASEPLALANFFSFYEISSGFFFTPGFRHHLTFSWREPFVKEIFLKPFKPPPLAFHA